MTARLFITTAVFTIAIAIGLALPADAHHSPLGDIRPIPKPAVTNPD